MAQDIINKNRLLEKYVQVIREDGLNTNKPVNIGLNGVTAPLWVSGNLSVGGNTTFFGSINGQTYPVTDLTGTTSALTVSQSGGLFMLDRAAGVTVTLPTLAAGLNYTFIVVTSVTSGNYKVTTGASNGLLVGLLQSAATVGGAANQWQSVHATSNISVTMNGTTTGGLEGSMFTVTGLTTGATGSWMVEGQLQGSGTLATPFTVT